MRLVECRPSPRGSAGQRRVVQRTRQGMAVGQASCRAPCPASCTSTHLGRGFWVGQRLRTHLPTQETQAPAPSQGAGPGHTPRPQSPERPPPPPAASKTRHPGATAPPCPEPALCKRPLKREGRASRLRQHRSTAARTQRSRSRDEQASRDRASGLACGGPQASSCHSVPPQPKQTNRPSEMKGGRETPQVIHRPRLTPLAASSSQKYCGGGRCDLCFLPAWPGASRRLGAQAECLPVLRTSGPGPWAAGGQQQGGGREASEPGSSDPAARTARDAPATDRSWGHGEEGSRG